MSEDCEELEIDFSPRVDESTFPDPIERSRLLDLIKRRYQTLQELNPTWRKLYQEWKIAYYALTKYQQERQYRYLDAKLYRHSTEVRKAERAFNLVNNEIQNTMGDLEMLENPQAIRRCNTDILQCVFEYCVADQPDSYSWFIQATRLSHVCYRWRMVALVTPFLWVCLEISLESPLEAIEAFWERSVQRVKSRAAAIYIAQLGDDEEMWNSLKALDFSQLPVIDRVSYDIVTKRAAKRLMEETPKLNLPLHGVYKLDIGSMGTRRGAQPILDVDPSPLISRFHSLGKLVWVMLDTFDFEDLPFNEVFKSVTKLEIRLAQNVQLDVLARAFPNAKDVYLSYNKIHNKHFNTGYEEKTIARVIWPKMTTLVVRVETSTSYLLFPWACLELPQIKGLYLPSKSYRNFTTDVLSKHPTIRYFDIAGKGGPFYGDNAATYSKLAPAAPQLLELATTADENLLLMTSTDFPNIQRLILYDDSHQMSSEIFDHIVRQRFLPPDLKSKYEEKGLDKGTSNELDDKNLEKRLHVEAGRAEKDLLHSTDSKNPDEVLDQMTDLNFNLPNLSSRTNPSLTILNLENFNPEDPPQWYGANLMKSATETRSISTRWGQTYTSYQYTWK